MTRILLACIFGGIIGYEREQTNRPAGLRTHLLVCVGSALTMMIGEYAFRAFGTHVDPTRIGAQVVSGIGFLGAGTIIKAGFNVRGLTTAASLWAVSCLGLACGMGYFAGAIICGITICVVLIMLKRFDSYIMGRSSSYRYRMISIKAPDIRVALTAATGLFAEIGVEVRDMRFSSGKGTEPSLIKMKVRLPNCATPELAQKLSSLPGIVGASIEETVD